MGHFHFWSILLTAFVSKSVLAFEFSKGKKEVLTPEEVLLRPSAEIPQIRRFSAEEVRRLRDTASADHGLPKPRDPRSFELIEGGSV